MKRLLNRLTSRGCKRRTEFPNIINRVHVRMKREEASLRIRSIGKLQATHTGQCSTHITNYSEQWSSVSARVLKINGQWTRTMFRCINSYIMSYNGSRRNIQFLFAEFRSFPAAPNVFLRHCLIHWGDEKFWVTTDSVSVQLPYHVVCTGFRMCTGGWTVGGTSRDLLGVQITWLPRFISFEFTFFIYKTGSRHRTTGGGGGIKNVSKEKKKPFNSPLEDRKS